MQIHQQRHGAVTVVRPDGPLNQSDADQFQQQFNTLAAKSLGRVVVDVSAVPFVDSRGLEVLAESADTLDQSGQALKLACVNEVLREVLDLTELSSRFEYFEDVGAAVRSFL